MNKELSLLSLAKKAGKLSVGNDAVLEALHTGRARLVILAADAAENTVRRFSNRHGDVPFEILPYSKETLGAAIGYKSCAAAALCDEGFTGAFFKARSLSSGANPDESFYRKPKETNN